MNAGKTIRAIARPVVALVLLGALAAALGGCDRHRGRHINYYNDGGYYGDVVVHRPPPRVVVVPRHYNAPPPRFRGHDGGRGFDHRR